VSVINAFLSTWSNARQTFGEGSPQTGEQYDNSRTLRQLESGLESAAPGSRWTGSAATNYDRANAEHRRVIGHLAGLDQRLAAEVDRSAQVVDAGRRNLDAVRQWVVDAAAGVPEGQAGERMKMAIAQKGFSQLQEIIRKSNAESNAIGGRIRGLEDEFRALGNQKFAGPREGPQFAGGEKDEEDKRRQNQIDAFKGVYGRDPVTQNDWKMAGVLDPTSYNEKNAGIPANVVVGRIKPVPGQGVVRTDLFIPQEEVWYPDVPGGVSGHNFGDNRGFDPNAGPKDTRVAIYVDYENGVIVTRQNPSVDTTTGEARTGIPTVAATQRPDGTLYVRYEAVDPFSPGGEDVGKLSPWSVNGNMVIHRPSVTVGYFQ
jgi:hypothetical protein